MKTLLQNTREVGSSSYGGENGHWLIACAITRESDCLERSNFKAMQQTLNALPAVKEWSGEFSPVTIERFSHWAVGWCDYLIVNPECQEAVASADAMRERLEDYPILDEQDFSALEQEEAEQVWRDCYRPNERIDYIRKHRSQFEFRGLADMLGCIRGRYFAGYTSELIS